MKIARKTVLGLGCLAIVGAITAFACTLPTGAVSVGGSVDIVVEVYASNSDTKINKPLDGDIYSDPTVTFSETHSHAKSVKYYLKKLNADGSVEWKKDITPSPIEGEDVSGTTTFTLNMDENGGPGVYVFESTIIGLENLPRTDYVQFTYAAINADQNDVSSTTDKVEYRVYYTPGVKSLTYQIFDANNDPVSDPVNINTPDSDAGGYMDIDINLSELQLESGKYQILTIGHSEENGGGQTIGSALVTFDYTSPHSPNVPDTGSLLAALNISRADYLLTGVIGFTGISIAALFIVIKTRKNDR